MSIVPIGLTGSSYQAAAPVIQANRTLNWFPVRNQALFPNYPLTLAPTPGLTINSDLSATVASGCRGLFINFGRLYGVYNNRVMSRASGGGATAFIAGTILNDALPAGFAGGTTNGKSLLISSGLGYQLLAAALTPMADPDFPPDVVSCTYLDGYFVVCIGSNPSGGGYSNRIYVSALNDPLTWDALDYTTFDLDDSYIKSCLTDRREVWVWTDNRVGIYYNSGNADFPLDLRPGGVIDYGNAAAASVVNIDGHIMWLGKDRHGDYHFVSAGRDAGYYAQRFSDNALDTIINNFAVVSDCIAFGQGDFYWAVFPSAGRCFVWDTVNKFWHERAYQNPATGLFEIPRELYSVFYNGGHICGDYSAPLLYDLGNRTCTDIDPVTKLSTPIRRLRVSNHLRKPGRGSDQLICNWLRVMTNTGNGLAVAAGVAGNDPQLNLRYSLDGANTWSEILQASTGKQGEYGAVNEYRRLGSSNISHTFEISTSEPVPVYLLEAYADMVTSPTRTRFRT